MIPIYKSFQKYRNGIYKSGIFILRNRQEEYFKHELIIKIKMNIQLAILVLLFGFIPNQNGCTKETEPQDLLSYTYKTPEQTGDGWQTELVNNVGLNPDRFNDLMRFLLNQQNHNVHSVLVIKDGKLVFEEYFSGEEMDISNYNATYVRKNFDHDTPHFLASATKSITSILTGVAIDKGFLKELDEKMFSFFPEYSNLSNTEKNKITISNMLTMSTGLPWDEGYPFDDIRNDLVAMVRSQEPIGFILAKPLTASPGDQFIYNSGTTNVLGEIISLKSGLTLNNFGAKYLFEPLGITYHTWIGCAYKPDLALASSGLYLTPRDMAKIGQLYLQKGIWNGNRVVSENWINESTKQHILVPANQNPMQKLILGYGYQWWIGSFASGNSETYFAAGYGGQYIFVFPKKNMVVVLTGGEYKTQNYNIFYDVVNNYILPSIEQQYL
jgi:CubicO group peptidase (beta-lactamase class C family)